ncbi:MAG: DUF131 domain-containing protein [Candidatus Bathyarchaeia archaeon]
MEVKEYVLLNLNFNYFYSFVSISASSVFDWSSLSTVGFLLVVAGVVITFLATVLLALQAAKTKEKPKTRGGGVIVLGPFPIVFGTDKETVKILLALSIILTVLAIVLTLISRGSL